MEWKRNEDIKEARATKMNSARVRKELYDIDNNE